jgi:branched-chain amino acid transport system permease protein
MEFSTLLQQLVNGVQSGAIYALIAVGYTMVYGILRMINFAHSEVYMAGAVVAWLGVSQNWFGVTTQTGIINLALLILTAMVVCMGLGVLIERLAYRPLRRAPRLIVLITAIGVSFLLQNLALILFGADPKTVPMTWRTMQLGTLNLSSGQLVLLVASLFFMAGLQLLVKRTRFGRAMRAVSEDLEAAALMGIHYDRVIMGTFAIGASLAGAAGAMTAIFVGAPVTPTFGFMPGMKAFISAVVGGIGHIPGAVLGGLMLGVIEALVGGHPTLSTFRDAVAFLLLIGVLLFRPAGLLGRASREKV